MSFSQPFFLPEFLSKILKKNAKKSILFIDSRKFRCYNFESAGSIISRSNGLFYGFGKYFTGRTTAKKAYAGVVCSKNGIEYVCKVSNADRRFEYR